MQIDCERRMPIEFNMQLHLIITLICMVLLPMSSIASDEENADEIPYSEAQLLIFKQAHLSNVDKPSILEYGFTQTGDQKFKDVVKANITHVYEDGKRDLSFNFLSGTRQKNFPKITGFRGNPLIMLFLEWDVGKMEDVPGISASQHYFRNKLRIGFWKYCKVDDVEILHNKQSFKGKRVSMRPFANNEKDRRMAAVFADKEYEIILVDDIPGQLYQISTILTSDENVAIESTQMTFNQLESL